MVLFFESSILLPDWPGLSVTVENLLTDAATLKVVPPQHTETRSAISAPNFGSYFSVTPFLGVIGDRADY
jgi:hypothetical protein